MPTSAQSNAYGFTGLTSLVADFKQPPLPTKANSKPRQPRTPRQNHCCVTHCGARPGCPSGWSRPGPG